MQCREPDSNDERDEGCLSGMVRVFGEADQGHEACYHSDARALRSEFSGIAVVKFAMV
jgi:hypothetical protein